MGILDTSKKLDIQAESKLSIKLTVCMVLSNLIQTRF